MTGELSAVPSQPPVARLPTTSRSTPPMAMDTPAAVACTAPHDSPHDWPASWPPGQPELLLVDATRPPQALPALVPRLRQKFNLQAPSWEESAAGGGLRSLEDYPHIVEQLTAVWGTRTGRDYLHRLMHDNRSGQRTGFPLEVVEEILLLQHVADAAWPGVPDA